jgi:hypothetical protein
MDRAEQGLNVDTGGEVNHVERLFGILQQTPSAGPPVTQHRIVCDAGILSFERPDAGKLERQLASSGNRQTPKLGP